MAISERAIDKLVKLKKEIEQARLDKASAEGALKQCLERLQTEFGVKSIEAAKKKLASMQERQEELTEEIEQTMKELEEEYDL